MSTLNVTIFFAGSLKTISFWVQFNPVGANGFSVFASGQSRETFLLHKIQNKHDIFC